MTFSQLDRIYQQVASQLRGGAPSTAQTSYNAQSYTPRTTNYRTQTTTNANAPSYQGYQSYSGNRSLPRSSSTNRRRY